MNLATIGSGAIVDLAYEAIEPVDSIHPVAVYSRTAQKARAYADRHHVEKAYDSLEEMFADPDIDTVYIASPNSLHYPQAKAALQAGKNVILEKPFAPTLAQSEDLFETAEKNGVMIFEAITNIHTPNFRQLKDHLDMGGTIREGVLNFSQYSSRYRRYMNHDVANVFNPAMDGGALMDINIYNIHLALGLFGMPEAVHYYPVIGWNGIDTSGSLILEYPDKTITCIGSKDSSSEYLAFLQGELGTFKICDGSTGRMSKVEFEHPMQENQPIQTTDLSVDQGIHMTHEFADFARAIETGDREAYEACKEQTLNAARILDQAKAQRDARAAALKN